MLASVCSMQYQDCSESHHQQICGAVLGEHSVSHNSENQERLQHVASLICLLCDGERNMSSNLMWLYPVGVFFHFSNLEIYLVACRQSFSINLQPSVLLKKNPKQFLSSFEYRKSYFFPFHPIQPTSCDDITQSASIRFAMRLDPISFPGSFLSLFEYIYFLSGYKKKQFVLLSPYIPTLSQRIQTLQTFNIMFCQFYPNSNLVATAFYMYCNTTSNFIRSVVFMFVNCYFLNFTARTEIRY